MRKTYKKFVLGEQKITFGEKVADKVACTVGSWHFILFQSFLIISWIFLNASGLTTYINLQPWDPYPFILLNLALSFQAAYTAPIIMMSQNRKEERDRMRAEADFEVNLIAEHEIALMQNHVRTILKHVKQNSVIKDELQTLKDELSTLKKILK